MANYLFSEAKSKEPLKPAQRQSQRIRAASEEVNTLCEARYIGGAQEGR